MDKFLDRFSNFFVRSVAPSSIFFVLLFFNDMYFNESKIKDTVINITKAEDKKETSKEISLNIKDLKISDDKEQIVITIDKPTISSDVKKTEKDKSKDTAEKSDENPNINLIYIFITILFIAYGYLNQILTQIVDYLHEKNFIFLWDKKFIDLKNIVKENLTDNEKKIFCSKKSIGIEFHDYNAYEVLGKEIEVGTFYVDEAKTINTFVVALMLNLVVYFLESSAYNCIVITSVLISIVILFFLTKARYKARNKRLYINYLLSKEKIQEIKVEIDE